MKKAFYLLLLIVLCVSLFVSCERDVKKGPFRVGNRRYETLIDAVNAASDGATVYLEADAEDKGSIISKNITLDLQEHTLTLADSRTGIFVSRDRTLILDGNGFLTAGEGFNARHLIDSSGTVKILNANISAQGHDTGAIRSLSGSVIVFGASHILADDGKEAIHISDNSYCYINTFGKLEGTIKTAGSAVVDFRNADLSSNKLNIDFSDSTFNPITAIRVSSQIFNEYQDTFQAAKDAEELLAYDHEAGFVFYDNGDKMGDWRYLMAAPVDLRVINGTPSVNPNDPGYAKGQATFNFGNNDREYWTVSEIGGGLLNTVKLFDDPPEDSGAKYCHYLELETSADTYQDWFLPSSEELTVLYEYLQTNGVGGFGADYYYTSTENEEDTAWIIGFNGPDAGQQVSVDREDSYYAVRPVRMFK